jgi:hypothetical protein
MGVQRPRKPPGRRNSLSLQDHRSVVMEMCIGLHQPKPQVCRALRPTLPFGAFQSTPFLFAPAGANVNLLAIGSHFCRARSLIWTNRGGVGHGLFLKYQVNLGFCDVNGKVHCCVSSCILACLWIFSDIESHSKGRGMQREASGVEWGKLHGNSFGKL